MVGTHKWLYAHYTHPDVYQRCYNWWLMISLSTFNVPIIDGWNAQMTLCSLHPPRRHIESVYQRSYNWWLAHYTHPDVTLNQHKWLKWIYAHYTHPDVILNQFINVPIIDGWNAQMTLCSLHPPRRHVESVYQRCYNWWLERTNDSMLITPTQTSNWIRLSTFL